MKKKISMIVVAMCALGMVAGGSMTQAASQNAKGGSAQQVMHPSWWTDFGPND